MDVLSHGLWAAIPFYTKEHSRRSYWYAFLFGVLPDLIAFAPQFILIIFSPHRDFFRSGPPPIESIYPFTFGLYNFTHSFVIFLAAFLIVYIICKKPLWEMAGWGLHIILDIPTHTSEFFPTPFLWPLSDFKVDGISWGQPWFLKFNYALLLGLYLVITIINRSKKKSH